MKYYEISTVTASSPWPWANMLKNMNKCENGWSNFSENLRIVALKLFELTRFLSPNQFILMLYGVNWGSVVMLTFLSYLVIITKVYRLQRKENDSAWWRHSRCNGTWDIEENHWFGNANRIQFQRETLSILIHDHETWWEIQLSVYTFVHIPQHICSGLRIRRCDGRNVIIFHLSSEIRYG